MRAGKIEISNADSAVEIVRLQGEHDLSTAPDLRRAFNDAFEREHAVLIDMSAVEFIDSSIVAVLVECGRPRDPETPAVSMFVPDQASPSVRRVLELTGLASHMEIHESFDAARKVLAGAGSG